MRRSRKKARHIVYIDLSAKAEQTTLDSAIAVSDGISWVYLVPADAKAMLHEWCKRGRTRHNAKYRALAVLIYVTVRERLPEIDAIVIDQDYTGTQPQAQIKNFLLNFLRQHRDDLDSNFIQFGQIKGSQADRLAKRVFDRKEDPHRTLSWEDIVKWLEK